MLVTIGLINELLMKGFAIRYTFFWLNKEAFLVEIITAITESLGWERHSR